MLEEGVLKGLFGSSHRPGTRSKGVYREILRKSHVRLDELFTILCTISFRDTLVAYPWIFFEELFWM